MSEEQVTVVTSPPQQPQTTSQDKPQQKKHKDDTSTKSIPQSQLQHAVDSSLISFIDRQVCVYTYDGSMFVGELNAFDQTNAVTLSNAYQRWVCQGKYAERQMGTVYLTGAHVCMIGTRDDTFLNNSTEVSLDEIFRLIREKPDNQPLGLQE